MKRRITYFLLLQLNFLFVNGQGAHDYFFKGYILVKADTIHCYVRNNNHFNDDFVIYKLAKDSKAQRIELNDVIEVFDNSFVYEKLKYKNTYYLLKRLVKGNISLYEEDLSEIESNDIENYNANSWIAGGRSLTSAPTYRTSTFYLKKADQLVEIKKKSFKEDIKSILTDDPETIKKIEEMKYKDVYDLIQAFVNNYNEWLKNKDVKVK